MSSRRRLSLHRITLCVVLIGTLCACVPVSQKGPNQKAAFNTVAEKRQTAINAEFAKLIRYANHLSTEKQPALKQARDDADVAFKQQSEPLQRMRLVLALSTAPATEAQLRRAQSLLVSYLSDARPSQDDGAYIPLALFLLARQRSQLKLLDQLQTVQAEQAKLKQKLHALMEVEQKMNHVEQSAPVQ